MVDCVTEYTYFLNFSKMALQIPKRNITFMYFYYCFNFLICLRWLLLDCLTRHNSTILLWTPLLIKNRTFNGSRPVGHVVHLQNDNEKNRALETLPARSERNTAEPSPRTRPFMAHTLTFVSN